MNTPALDLPADMTERPAFRAWFAGSRITDDQGRPLVLYHATNADFSAFEIDRGIGVAGQGIYLTDRRPSDDRYGTFVMPLYAAIRQPADFRAGDGAISDMAERLGLARLSDMSSLTQLRTWSAALRQRLLAAGFDGALVCGEQGANYVVAFHPQQVKSALGNSGSFDPENPDIRYARAAHAPLPDEREALSAGFWRWFGHSRITDTQGRPLVVYHGTHHDFSVFQSQSPTTVIRLDGEEIQRADSWDMGDDRSGMPQGYHYMALGNARDLGADVALRLHLAEVARLGLDGPDTRRITRDLLRLQGKRLTFHTEIRPTGDGFYFTPDRSYSFIRDIGQRPGGQVMPVYLSIQNPIWLNASQIETAGLAERMAAYRAQGYDGAIFANYPDDLTRRGWNGATQIVAFDARQIKSAIGNSSSFDPENPDIRFARAWHGSPHDFDRFSLNAVGSGEGHQAFGWGLYFASEREVAQWYRDSLTQRRPENVTRELVRQGIPDTLARTFADYYVAVGRGGPVFEGFADIINRPGPTPAIEQFRAQWRPLLPQLQAAITGITGHLYEVEIPDDGDLLDWDLPLSAQPAPVQAVLRAQHLMYDERDYDAQRAMDGSWRIYRIDPETRQASQVARLDGEDARTPQEALAMSGVQFDRGQFAYESLVRRLGSAQDASRYLLSLGVRGIRYLDGGSRNGERHTHNYVIFDDQDVRMVSPAAAQSAARYARTAAPAAPQEAIETALQQHFGPAWQALRAAGRVQLVARVADLPGRHPGDLAGLHDPRSGITWLVAENLTPETAPGYVLHEVGVHAGLPGMLGERLHARLLAAVDALVTAGHPQALAARAKARDLSHNPNHVAEETLAYLVQDAPQLSVCQQVISGIRQFVWRVSGGRFFTPSVADCQALAWAGVDHAARQARLAASDVPFPLGQAPRYARAWHGSPHAFEAFSRAHVGQGDGVQAYGHGLYFAEHPAVAHRYQTELAQLIWESSAGPLTDQGLLDRLGAAIAAQYPDLSPSAVSQVAGNLVTGLRKAGSLAAYLDENPTPGGRYHAYYQPGLRALEDLAVRQSPGYLYEVDLQSDPGSYLDWDQPMSAQPASVQQAIGSLDLGDDIDPDTLLGAGIYQRLSAQLGGQAAASEHLALLGVRGIRYQDDLSRNQGVVSHNYVVFEDRDCAVVSRSAGPRPR